MVGLGETAESPVTVRPAGHPVVRVETPVLPGRRVRTQSVAMAVTGVMVGTATTPPSPAATAVWAVGPAHTVAAVKVVQVVPERRVRMAQTVTARELVANREPVVVMPVPAVSAVRVGLSPVMAAPVALGVPAATVAMAATASMAKVELAAVSMAAMEVTPAAEVTAVPAVLPASAARPSGQVQPGLMAPVALGVRLVWRELPAMVAQVAMVTKPSAMAAPVGTAEMLGQTGSLGQRVRLPADSAPRSWTLD